MTGAPIRAAALALALAASLAAAGCHNAFVVSPGPGAPYEGIYFDVTFPNEIEKNNKHATVLHRDDIELGDYVDAHTTGSFDVTIYLPYMGRQTYFGARESSYGAYRKLCDQFGYDGLLNTFVDTRFWQVDVYFFKFSGVETHVGGLGYRLKRKPT